MIDQWIDPGFPNWQYLRRSRRVGGFRGAAKELGIAPSAVSHAISSLEQSLGVRLLARTTRSVAVTEEGALLLKRLRPALGEIDLALDAVKEANNRVAGNLRLSVPPFAAHWLLAPRLAAFSEAYPGVTLELRVEEPFNDIVATGVDAGMRLGESLEPDMIAVRMSDAITGQHRCHAGAISKTMPCRGIRATFASISASAAVSPAARSIAGNSKRMARRSSSK